MSGNFEVLPVGTAARLAELEAEVGWLRSALNDLRDSTSLAHTSALRTRAEKAEAEVEQIKKNRDYWFESCQQAQVSRDLAIVENSFFEADINRLRALLQRIRQWDMLGTAADGAFWKREIDAALKEGQR